MTGSTREIRVIDDPVELARTARVFRAAHTRRLAAEQARGEGVSSTQPAAKGRRTARKGEVGPDGK